MKFVYDNKQEINPRVFMQRIGYAQHHNESYISRLGSSPYPRFHLYLKKTKQGKIIFDLHLDQKKPIYKGVKAHAGEYDSPVVEEEMRRISKSLPSSP